MAILLIFVKAHGGIEMSWENHNQTRYIPVTIWNQYHDWPPVGGLRYLIFNAKSNGFNHVVKRVGRKVLIDEQAFFEWVASKNKEIN